MPLVTLHLSLVMHYLTPVTAHLAGRQSWLVLEPKTVDPPLKVQ